MEVTTANFGEAFDKIKKILPSIDFVSFDGEFSGLGFNSQNRCTDLDTIDERYEKTRKGVMNHGLIQFGISFFRFCQTQKKYFSSTFCFFLAGKKDDSYTYDVSSMKFLADHNFDFNKLFRDGLFFLSINDVHEIRAKREQKLAEEQVPPILVKNLDKEMKKFVKESIKKIEKAKADNEVAIFSGSSLSSPFRKLLYNNIASEFPMASVKGSNDYDRNIVVTHFKSLQEKEAHINGLWEKDFLERMGFIRVIQLLLESGKPLVMHNGLSDLLHFVNKFFMPLPESFDDFRLLCKSNLPDVYDTKLIAKDPPFSGSIPNTALAKLYEELATHFSPPDVLIEEGYKSYNFREKERHDHDAGFDAYMTGICFLTMLKTLGGAKWATGKPVESQKLKQYSNKINFMFSYDYPYIDVQKEQDIPDRSHLFTVICPATFNMIDARNLLKQISAYKMVWINDTKFHVIVEDYPNSTELQNIMDKVSNNCPPNVFITKYETPQPKSRTTNGKAHNTTNRKRSSNPDDHSSSKDDSSADDTIVTRSLKRLKSVGASELSQMTLESPTEEKGQKIPQDKIEEFREKVTSSTAFDVPDEW